MELTREQIELDKHYTNIYRCESDEQLYERLRAMAKELGRMPTKKEIPAVSYLKSRFGNLPRMMEKAGLKPVSERRQLKK